MMYLIHYIGLKHETKLQIPVEGQIEYREFRFSKTSYDWEFMTIVLSSHDYSP